LESDCTDSIPENISWIIIGGLSPHNVHKKEWVDSMIERARKYNIPIWLKRNLNYDKVIRELPN